MKGVRGSRSSARASGSAFWPDDGAAVGAAGFLEGAGRAERAGVIGGADQNSLGLRLAQMLADALERRLELPVAVDRHDRPAGGLVHDLANAREHAPHPRGRQRARSCELDEQDLVDLAVPLLSRPPRQMTSGEQPGLVVVRAEIRGSRMRNVDGDQRDAGLLVLRGDSRGDGLVGLELDDQIDAIPDQAARRS